MKSGIKLALSLASCALISTPLMAADTVLFEDKFETDSSANWSVFGDSPTDVADHTAQFAFDYSAQQYTSNGVTRTIPPAPNSGAGETKGVKLTVNSDATAETAAVSLYPTGQTFSGNYALRADLWMNYPGAAAGEGSAGSTELATFGINHTGTRANWHSSETVGDGLWFAMAGEGGAAQDYRAYEWDGFSVAFLRGAAGGLIGEDHGEQVFRDRFPGAFYESVGAPGKQWAQVEVQQRDGNIIWKVNGYVIAERPNSTGQLQGNVMIGLMDVFSSIASPAADSYVIFDNVRVVQLNDPAPPTVTITAADPMAAEPGSDTATLTVARSIAAGTELVVNYRVFGSAGTNDYVALPGSVTIPSNQTSVDITFTAKDDPSAEPEENLTFALLGSSNYELRGEASAVVTIADDGDTTAVSLSSSDPWAYEKIPADAGAFTITRVGDNTADLTVNFTLAGTAAVGEDYQSVGTSVVLPAGIDAATVRIVPIDNDETDGDRTVLITLAAGTGYQIPVSTNYTITIRDDEGMPSGEVLFSDNFDTDTSAQWTVNEAHVDSNRASFNWDYSAIGIPAAPNTTNNTTRGLKLEANVGAPTFTGLSVSPVGENFEGDYRLSFDMWINYNGPLPAGGAGSTMSLSAGVGTSGTAAQFPGSSVEGVLFSVTGEGGSGSDWRAYAATGAPATIDQANYAAGSLNNTAAYYAPFGRATATEVQLSLYSDQTGLTPVGGPGLAWHEVVIEKRGTNFTWYVDNLRIATITLTNKTIGSNIFVGFFDINATQTGNQDLSFGLVDNLRVEGLPDAPAGDVTITSVTRSGNNLVITFDGTGFSSFVLESSATVDGTYTAEAGAQITGNTATVPIATGNRFFRIRAQ